MTPQEPFPLPEASSLSEESLRLKRFDKIIDKKVTDFVSATQIIMDHEKNLTFEVEELRNLKESLKRDLKQGLQEEINQLIPFLIKQVSEGFQEQMHSLTLEPLKSLQTIHQQAERTIGVLKATAIQSRKHLILMGISLVAAVCLSCGVMALVFFYCFPQHTHLRYETSWEQIQQMIEGKTLQNTFKRLPPDIQALLNKAKEETIRQLFLKKKTA